MYDVKDVFPTDEDRAVIKLACEMSLKRYIRYIHKFTTGTDYTFQPFHDDIIKALEARATQDTIKNLMINMPVGFGKSLIIEYFISWCFARNKNNTFLYTSYGDKLITKLSNEIKDIIESEPFQYLWGYSLKKSEKSKVNWSIEGGVKRSGLTAGAMGGTITGLDAGNPAVKGFSGALVIDDPISANKVIFERAREDCRTKYSSTLKTRRRRNDVPIIMIAQRLDEEDLAGYIIENEAKDWDIITVKAMVGNKSIWEDKVSTEQLSDIQERTPDVFISQYQQSPDSNLNSMFAAAKYEEDIDKIHNGIGHIDKGFDGSDFTAFTIIKKQGDRLIVFGKLWDKHIEDCHDDIIKHRDELYCGTIHTEKNDDKGFTAKELQKKGLRMQSYHESMNKHQKIMTFGYANWKDIYFVDGTDPEYIKQVQRYNENASHDDAPDGLASAVRIVKPQSGTRILVSERFIP
jgi:hypothetical protein